MDEFRSDIHRLYLKNVPENCKKENILKFCSRFGEVVNISNPPTNPQIAFIDYKNTRSLQNALAGFSENPYGMKAEIAKVSLKNPKNLNKSESTAYTNRSKTNSESSKDPFEELLPPSSSESNSKKNSSTMPYQVVRKCVLCKKSANKKCQRCGDFYCSNQCQQKDWSTHRYICMPMPNLIDIENDFNEPSSTAAIQNNEISNHEQKINHEIQQNKEKEYHNTSYNNLRQQRDSSSRQQSHEKDFSFDEQTENYNRNNQMNGGDKRRSNYNNNNNNRENQNRQKNFNDSYHKRQDNKSDEVDFSDISENRNKHVNDNKMNQNNRTNQNQQRNMGKSVNTRFQSNLNDGNNKRNSMNLKLESQDNCFQNHDAKHSNNRSSENINKSVLKQIDTDKKNVAKDEQIDTPANKIKESIKTPVTKPGASDEQLIVIDTIMAPIPPNGSSVIITTVDKPNLLYVRPLDKHQEFAKILAAIDDAAKESKPIEKMPQKGEMLISCFDEIYYRVVVLCAQNENDISVLYLDYGNSEKKKLSDLRTLPAIAKKLKCYTFAIQMKNVPDFKMIDTVRDYLSSFTDDIDNPLEMIHRGNSIKGRIEAELKVISTGEILNRNIVKLSGIQLEVEENGDKNIDYFTVQDIEINVLPSNENLELIVLDNSLIKNGLISCILPKNLEGLFVLGAELKKYAEEENIEPHVPKKSELIIVQFVEDDDWYRAECVGINDDEFIVYFIDYGNLSTSDSSRIRKYPQKFINHPLCSSLCEISEFPNHLSDSAIKRIQELLPANEMISVDKILNNCSNKDKKRTVIYLPNLIKTMKNEKIM